MDFESRVATGIRAFTHYNRYKKRIMRVNDPLGSRVILDLFPLCIHINHPALRATREMTTALAESSAWSGP
jgi:hypothetical protein